MNVFTNEFISSLFIYILIFILTIISTAIYALKTVYISKEKTKAVLLTNGLYIIFNTIITRSIVKGNAIPVVIISMIASEIGYFLGLNLKNIFDPSMQKEDKLWVFDVKCSDDLAKRFMLKYGNAENIQHVRINSNQQEFICSSKPKSKLVRNLIEVYNLEHTIQERFNFKHKKLTEEETKEIKNNLESDL